MYETPDDFITALELAREDEDAWRLLAKYLMSQIVKSGDSKESERFIEAVLLRLPSADTRRLLTQEADGWTPLEKASFGSVAVSRMVRLASGEVKLLSDKTDWSVKLVAGTRESKKSNQVKKIIPVSRKSKSKTDHK